MAHVRVTDTTLRDGHQSLWATRMRINDMLPIIEKMDSVGYHSVEVWGGATFDVCMRYLDEDPWERLRTLKQRFKKTPLQMLLRGQSLLGYTHYPDDLARAFVHKSVENGIDIIRIFDALNDIRNLESTMRFAKEAGAHVQAAIVYTISPVHTMDHYVETAKHLAQLGADSLCIKDMAGLLLPFKSRELVTRIKQAVDLPLQLHTHYIGGMAVGACLKGVEAGVDVIDAASLPLAFGASQPPIETLVRALDDTEYATNLDIHELFEITRYFEELRKKLGYPRGVTRISDMQVFDHQVPGGMISNLISQLEQQKAVDRLDEVLNEIPSVRADLGYPPLVTPTSQIVGTQAVLNILLRERYKLVPGEVKLYVKGMYGQPPGPINQEVAHKILGDEPMISVRPADLLEPVLERCRTEIADLAQSEEDVLSYALFPQVAKKFLLERKSRNASNKEENAAEETQSALTASPEEISATYNNEEDSEMNLNQVKELIQLVSTTDIAEVQLESGETKITIRKGTAMAAIANPTFAPAPMQAPTAPVEPLVSPVTSAPVRIDASPAEKAAQAAANPNLVTITAPMVGTFYRSPGPEAPAFVEKGTKVSPSQTVCIIEAMKLMNEIEAEHKGTIVEILAENAQSVEYGQPLFILEKA